MMQPTAAVTITGNITGSSQNATIPLGKYQVGYHSILLFLAVCIILHNFLVLFLYLKIKNLHNSTNVLLVNLSCADFLTGFLLIPLLISSAAFSGRHYVVLYFTSNVVSDLITLAIVLSLLLVTLERYIALCHPYLHPKIATNLTTKIAIAVLWMFSVTVAILPLSWSYPLLIGQRKDVDHFYKYYSLMSLIGCFFIPSGVMLFCLVSMFLIINRFIRQDTTRGMSVRSGRRAQRKAVCVFLAMYVNLFVCWSPLVLIRLLMDTKKNFKPSLALLEILVALRCCSSLLNPAIYVWCKKDFKTALFKIFFKRFQVKNKNFRSEPAVAANEEQIKDTLL